MLDHLETTIFVLIWCFGLSGAFGILRYQFVGGLEARESKIYSSKMILVPALVLVPLAIRFFYDFFDINLFYPVHFLVSSGELFVRAIAPAAVLLVASGLIILLSHKIRDEYTFWMKMPFIVVTESLGRSPKKELRRLVVVKAYLDAWQNALPWLFGELIVVESLFNAPGLASQLWRSAKAYQWWDLACSGLALVVLFYLISESAAKISRIIGVRLSGYA